jgi:hypothetical protein
MLAGQGGLKGGGAVLKGSRSMGRPCRGPEQSLYKLPAYKSESRLPTDALTRGN